jgi:hypothetical protein
MKAPATRFPSLGSEAALADVQVRQTMAMGLVPLGIALLLMAAMSPDPPRAGLWIGALLSLGGTGLIWSLWRRSGHRYMRGYSTTHFLVRYLFIVLCPALLWMVFGGVLLELAGWLPPALLGLLLLLYPVGRILRERVGGDPLQAPHVEMARILCRVAQMALGVLAGAGMLSGAIVEAQQDYPTDPTPLLLFLWILALLMILSGVVLAAAHWIRLFDRSGPPQPLDDVPPAPPAGLAPRFGSDRF